jgi:hypothetical protein
MTDLLSLVVLDGAAVWLEIFAVLGFIVSIPKLFGLNFANALAYAQMTLAFNAITIIGGREAELVDLSRTVHFFVIEFAFFILTCAAYRVLLKHRAHVIAALTSLFAGPGGAWLTVFMSLVCLFNFVMAPADGESRIAYMTAGWYSLLKPFIQLATPLAYVGVFMMLMMPARRRLAFLLLLVTLFGNVLSGSKASKRLSCAMRIA